MTQNQTTQNNFCKSCGTSITQEDRFCRNCGNKITRVFTSCHLNQTLFKSCF